MKKFVFGLFYVLTSFVYASECKIVHYRLGGATNTTVESVCNYYYSLYSKYQSLRIYNDYKYQLSISGLNCTYVITANGERHEETFTVEAVYDEDCVKNKENKCTSIAGKFTKLSVPAGWAHLDSTGEVRDFKSSGPAPDQVCKGGCRYLLMSNEVVPGSTVYAPKINNGGYHPVFTQYTYAGTDTQCEADTDLTTPSTPPPPPEKPKEPEKPFTCPTGKCPGVANDQQVCVPCGSAPGQGEGDGDDKGKDKDPGDSSGNNNGRDKGDKDGNKDGSSDGTPGGTGNSSGGINGPGTGNGNGTGNGKDGKGNGKGSGGGGGGGTMKGEKDGEKEDNTPPSFGERPGLYEPKYKNGVKGVWDQKKGQMQNSGLGRLSKRLMPTVNSGTCPRWDVDLNFGRNMNFGTKNVAPPCTIWPILRAIVMVCALLLARRLVFGG